jgi:hypothetical protein
MRPTILCDTFSTRQGEIDNLVFEGENGLSQSVKAQGLEGCDDGLGPANRCVYHVMAKSRTCVTLALCVPLWFGIRFLQAVGNQQ